MEPAETELIYCRRCLGKTNHSILCSRTEEADPEEFEIWRRTHYLAQCAGCETYCYATATETAENLDPNSGEMVPEWTVYPTSEGEKEPLEKYYLFPTRVKGIYLEVIKSINGDLLLLSAIGLRALLEAICKDQEVKGRNLVKLIDGLADEGVLSKKQSGILHGLRFMGNAAAHEIERPDREEVLAALGIAEAMLNVIYVLPHLSKEVKTGRRD